MKDVWDEYELLKKELSAVDLESLHIYLLKDEDEIDHIDVPVNDGVAFGDSSWNPPKFTFKYLEGPHRKRASNLPQYYIEEEDPGPAFKHMRNLIKNRQRKLEQGEPFAKTYDEFKHKELMTGGDKLFDKIGMFLVESSFLVKILFLLVLNPIAWIIGAIIYFFIIYPVIHWIF